MQILGDSTPLFPAVIASYSSGEVNLKRRLLAYFVLAIIGSFLLTISAKVQLPFYPVPMTMQTLVVLLIGMTYGPCLAAVTISLYIIQGVMGFPVFAGGGGIAYFIGPTGGYIIGFLISATFLGLLANRGWGKTWKTTAISMIAGVFIIFLSGISWLSIYIGFEAAILKGFIPFIYADCLKIIIASFVMPTAWSFVDKILK